MKKFITLLAVVLLCSCDFDTEAIIPGSEKSLINDTKLVELTFEGHTHQYIFNHSYVGGYGGTYDVEIIHWESCKYCKEDKQTD